MRAMKKNIPLKIEQISALEERECRITSAREIESIVRDTAHSGANTALYYNPNNNFIMTTILDVDEDGMWLEPGRSATANFEIKSSKLLRLVSAHNQVKIQFTVGSASSVSYDGHPALFVPLPDSLYRLQRREFFRLALPPTEQLHCIVNITSPKTECVPIQNDQHDMTVIDIEMPATDISGGGIGLVHKEGEDDIRVGETYSACQINLPETGTILVDILVKNIIPLSTTRAGQTILRAGCEFKSLDAQTANKLQRFITEKQRLLAAKGLL